MKKILRPVASAAVPIGILGVIGAGIWHEAGWGMAAVTVGGLAWLDLTIDSLVRSHSTRS